MPFGCVFKFFVQGLDHTRQEQKEDWKFLVSSRFSFLVNFSHRLNFLSQQSKLKLWNICLKLDDILTDKYALVQRMLLQIITIDQEIYCANELASFDETALWLLGRPLNQKEIVRLLLQVGAYKWNELPRINIFSEVLMFKNILKSDREMR